MSTTKLKDNFWWFTLTWAQFKETMAKNMSLEPFIFSAIRSKPWVSWSAAPGTVSYIFYLFFKSNVTTPQVGVVPSKCLLTRPFGPSGVGPGCTDKTLLSAIASALHTSAAPITGQLSAAVEKNPGVWLNTTQPLCKAFIVTDEDIRWAIAERIHTRIPSCL